MKKLLLFFLVAVSPSTFAQRIKLVEGDASVLRGQRSINLEFTYDIGRVENFASEKEFIDRKKADLGARGEKWETNWFSDRKTRYEPHFRDAFAETSMSSKQDAEYTIIFNTAYIDPGSAGRYPAYIDGVATLVATSDKNKVIAKWKIDGAPARMSVGFTFDFGTNLQQCYSAAGDKFGSFLTKNLRK